MSSFIRQFNLHGVVFGLLVQVRKMFDELKKNYFSSYQISQAVFFPSILIRKRLKSLKVFLH